MITASGGDVNAGEVFNIVYAPGGLTGTTACILNGLTCTGYVVDSDTTAHATAPTTGFQHGITNYSMVIE